ncbi:hypothetical protein cypCar_00049398, partial [Cyprinus carpio]
DVELFVFYQETHQPSAIVEAGVTTAPPGSLMRDPVVMISLYPEFPEEVMSSLATRGEFVFVIDRSGSMGDMMHHGKGAQMRIESAKLFVFTDGEVGDTKEVLDLVKSHAHSHRCFSFGIGEGASAALITGMAREGSGHAQFITDTDRMQPK